MGHIPMTKGNTSMKKWTFWMIMCLVSLANGACFFAASLSSMRAGVSGVEHQAALLFIPLLWIVAVIVIALLNACTLIQGRRIRRESVITLRSVFDLSGLSDKAHADRVLFFGASAVLMLFAYSLFASKLLSSAYALTGGLLLLFLYAWRQAARC